MKVFPFIIRTMIITSSIIAALTKVKQMGVDNYPLLFLMGIIGVIIILIMVKALENDVDGEKAISEACWYFISFISLAVLPWVMAQPLEIASVLLGLYVGLALWWLYILLSYR